MKKLHNTLFFLLALPAFFVFLAVMLGGNVWISSLLIFGLPILTFLAVGLAPSFFDWLNNRKCGESEIDKIDKYPLEGGISLDINVSAIDNSSLAKLVNLHLREFPDFWFYREFGEKPHPVHALVIETLWQYLIIDSEFNRQRGAALLDCDPELFSLNDVKLAVRALWKSERVGFYHTGEFLYKNGWISKLLSSLSELKDEDCTVPLYPLASEIVGDFNPKDLWNNYKGFWRKNEV